MEIKRTVLPPFGGSREEMGGGASAWTYGRGVIGSPADGVVVPDLTGLTASEALEALGNVGLVSSASAKTSGATEGNNGTVASQSPNPGILVNAGSTVVYSVFEYIEPEEPGSVSWTWSNPEDLASGLSLVFLSSVNHVPLVSSGVYTNAGWEYSIDGGAFTVWEPSGYQEFNYFGGADPGSLMIADELPSGAIVLALNPGQTVQWKTSEGLLTPIVTVQAPLLE